MNITKYQEIKDNLKPTIQLVAVSKTKPVEDIMALYKLGQRIFGENKAQELKTKHELLPQDIEWHFIGHLQSNKIKYIIPFVSLIHSIDSFDLLKEVNSQAIKHNRVISCLLQFHIAEEDSKYGFSEEEAIEMLEDSSFIDLQNVKIVGVMGMATFTEDNEQIRHEFQHLYQIFDRLKKTYFATKSDFKEVSMGMTDDYPIAIEEGSTLIRIGSAIFGSRQNCKVL